jgi:shikimate 5-dehydrogenase
VSRRFVFVGVSTGSSSIMQVFPRWRDVLGLPGDVEMHGLDLPPGAPADDYRAAMAWMRDEPGVVGALVTTHKLDLLRAARDLFEELDPWAERLHEVSCIAVRGERVLGWAKDPLTAARALDDLLGAGPPREVLCMGSGGAAAAISLVLLERGAARLVLTDRDPDRLDHLRALHEEGQRRPAVEYVHVAGAGDHDDLLAAMGRGALVINATGLGKDRPGSPLSDAGRFPQDAIAWDLNYRGDLVFLRQAQAAGVRAQDGWRYFIYGWTAVIEEVFERPIGDDDIDRLSEAAAFARPGSVPRT